MQKNKDIFAKYGSVLLKIELLCPKRRLHEILSGNLMLIPKIAQINIAPPLSQGVNKLSTPA